MILEAGQSVHKLYYLGMRPAPRIWMNWNLEKLEPKGLKINDDSLSQTRSRKSKLMFLVLVIVIKS